MSHVIRASASRDRPRGRRAFPPARGACAAAVCATAGWPGAAGAHGEALHGLTDLRHAYTLDPLVLVPMAVVLALYAGGLIRLWRRAGLGRGVEAWRAACFAGGMLALVLALIWPFDALAGAALSAHMAQHVLLTVCAAPLLAASSPWVTALWALPGRWRRRLGGLGRSGLVRGGRLVLTLPIVAWFFYAAMLWSWHMPGLYEAALRNDALHTLEHVAFLSAALLLWWTVLLSVRGSALGLGSGIFLLFTTGLQEGLLGALLTFSPRTLYAYYADAPGIWGITPVEDQQLAGILMWIPGGAVYLGAAMLLTYLWLAQLGRAHPLPEPTAGVPSEARHVGLVRSTQRTT